MTPAERRAYIARIMNRLERQYAARTPLPMRDAMTVWPEVAEREMVLSLRLLQRLYRCVTSEGYGE